MAPDEYIRLEKNARNNAGPYADNIGEVPPNIYVLENMPLMYENRLPLEKIYNELLTGDIKVEYSTDAGSYVCNYLFYNLMAFGDNHRTRNSLGFIHLPPISNRFSLDKSRRSVKIILNAVIDNELDKIKKQNN
jgi:pyroglutamyl-peptidase